ncbi:MAG TPA: prephenate dehydratase [Actinomycetota bacterium]|nr:prephenate dehydratase [Actinomycetota bacterium]
MKVAYQGEPGAYSERAVRGTFADAEPLPCDSVRLVFSRVTSGEAAFGVVPLENSQAGSVNETYELLQHTSLLRIVGEVVVRVDHALLGVPGARLEEIRRARSHWQALAQCEGFLASMHIEAVPVHDTAGAARMIADSGSREDAAIASVDAAGIFGLAVLAERIQTEQENYTKFAVLGLEADPGLGAPDKTSLVMSVLDEPGSLLGALRPFADRGINLHKLESRPRRGKPFEYVMYVDVMADGASDDLRDALREVEAHTSMLRVLGTYRSAGEPV